MVERVGNLWAVMIILQNNGDLWDLDLKHLNQDIGLSNRGR
jgi:hypothetical protein